jgi:hypothetical protein
MNNTKLTLAIVAIFVSGNLFSQNSTSSPYSRYGIGDLANQKFGQFQGMGSTSIGIRNSYHLNFTNPASYTAIDSLSFIWEFGANSRYTEYSTINENQSKLDMTFNSMTAGFPITRWWRASFGLLPYSSVGYTISTDSLTTSPWGESELQRNYYNGSGGINQVYFGSGFQLPYNFSVGVNARYLFGTVDHTRTFNVLNEDGTINPDNYSIQEIQQLVVSDVTYDFGLQYQNSIKKKWNYTLGLVFANQSKVTGFNDLFIERVNGFGLSDTITDTESEKDYILLPRNIGLGVSFYNESFLFAADYTTQDWSNSTFLGKKDSLANLHRVSAGMEYIPNYRSLRYFAKVRYRLGAKYENSYLNLSGEQLNDYSVSFGLGLPMRKRKSTINITFELGKRGTTNNNLIEENYGLISLNLSLHDIWFVRRKFD